MIDFAEPIVQRELMNALVQVMRSTIDRRPLSQDELALLVSLGERFTQFRQDVGDFLQARLDEGIPDATQAAAIQQLLKRWSSTP